MIVKQSPAAARRGASTVQMIHSTLFNAILSQDLRPGTKLSEESIGSFFNVSRTIVRAALTRLHAESLIELRQNRGAFVASPSIDEAKNVFEARICVESEIIKRLARNITAARIKELVAHTEREHLLEAAADRHGALQMSGEFHLLIAQMAGNEVLTNFLKSLISRTSLILALYSDRRENDCSAEEHVLIIQPLRDANPAGAIDAMVNHLEGVLGRADLGEHPGEALDIKDILARYVD